MAGGGEYEPQDSRKVVGTQREHDKSWREQENTKEPGGEYEPADSRNVTGQASETPERWRNEDREPPLANGERPTAAERAESRE
jgi:hypothetical protein